MIYKRKFIPLLFLLSILIPSNFSLAYEAIPTHRDLTAKIVEVYNKYYEPKITKEQADLIIDGAVKEDAAPRWVNHFYDPLYKSGWNGENQSDISQDTIKKLSKIFLSANDAVSSFDWMHNEALQDKYGLYEGNQTYDRAISAFAYAKNIKDKIFIEGPNYSSFENAFAALGHTLHLLEDMGVPAHVRNDSHGDGDPYERWAAEPGNDNLSVLDNLKVSDLNFNCQTVDDCFINLAKYTNENFYSQDTINDSKYQLPRVIKKEIISEDTIYYSENDNYYFPLFIKDKNDYPIIDNNIIHQAYWNLLSKQVVLAGVKTIKVFYEDAKKETELIQFQPHAVAFKGCDIPFICKDTVISPFGEITKLTKAASSFFGNVVNTTKNTLAGAGTFIKNIFGNNKGLRQVDQVATDSEQNGENAVSVNTNTYKKNQNFDQIFKKETIILENDASVNDDESADLQKKIDKPIEKEIINVKISTSTAKDVKPETPKLCLFNSQNPNRAGVIINEIAWMGGANSASDEWIELKNISSLPVNLSGWQILSKDGDIKINLSELKTASLQPGKFILLERTDNNSASGVSANLVYSGALSNSNEELRLFDFQCNLVDQVEAASSWPAGDNSLKKTMERNTDGSSSSSSYQFGWHTSANAGGTPKQNNSQPITYNQQLSSGGGGGGGSPSAQQAADNPRQFSKIIISEIKISPAEERFIEIYNPNNVEVSLTDWYIQRKTGSEFSSFISKTNFEGKKIPANGYFLISRSALAGSDVVISDLVLTDSNVIQLKNPNQEVADKAGWGSIPDFEGSGAAFSPADGQSIQRKVQNNNFSDTDNNENDFEIQNCPSPKAQSGNCQTNAVSINAQFSFFPIEPEENDLITFDAASSTASFGSISLYEWQFGDNNIATSTEPLITHSFMDGGIYTAQLIVYGEGNSSSTTSSNINVSGEELRDVGHVVISEILFDAEGSDAGKEFIKLYNPTGSDIDINGWSMRILTGNSTSSDLLVSFGSKTGDISLIKAKGFLLAGFSNYDATATLADTVRSVSLPNSPSTVYFLNGEDEEIDNFSYGTSDILEGQSIERKAFKNNECVSSQNIGEFFGNGCDTDNDLNNFEIRLLPNPQNSSSLPEPRNAPAMVQNFTVAYEGSGPALDFNWDPSFDYAGESDNLYYKIIDSSLNFYISDINTTSTTEVIGINEVGRIGEDNYKFYIQAFDKDGLGSASSTVSVDAPSFASNISFFKDPNSENANIEFYYDKYPFIPDRYSGVSTWRMAAFYLNQDPIKVSNFDELTEWGRHASGTIKMVYDTCSGYNPLVSGSVVFPDSENSCNVLGGSRSNALKWDNLEDLHFIIKTDSSNPVFKDGDYLTVASYGYDGNNEQILVAVDKLKYYFGNEVPVHQAPLAPTDVKLESYTNNLSTSTIEISLVPAVDPDTVDNLLKYEWSTDGIDWNTLNISGRTEDSKKYFEISLKMGVNYNLLIRAIDDFNNVSESASLIIDLPALPEINLTPDSSNSYFAIDEAKVSSGLLKIKWRLISNPVSNGVFGIIPFNPNVSSDGNIVYAKALHRDVNGNSSYPQTTASSAGSRCNASITPITNYILGQQYETDFSSLTGGSVPNDLIGKEIQFYIFGGYNCLFSFGSHIFQGYPVVISN